MKPCNLSGIKYPENTNCHVSLQAAAKIRNNRESFIKKSKIITTTPHNSATLIGNLQNETISTPHLSENKRPPKAPLIATSIALIICDDILNSPQRYPQRPARISSTARDDILVQMQCLIQQRTHETMHRRVKPRIIIFHHTHKPIHTDFRR